MSGENQDRGNDMDITVIGFWVTGVTYMTLITALVTALVV